VPLCRVGHHEVRPTSERCINPAIGEHPCWPFSTDTFWHYQHPCITVWGAEAIVRLDLLRLHRHDGTVSHFLACWRCASFCTRSCRTQCDSRVGHLCFPCRNGSNMYNWLHIHPPRSIDLSSDQPPQQVSKLPSWLGQLFCFFDLHDRDWYQPLLIC
jgi:hypothetical protein